MVTIEELKDVFKTVFPEDIAVDNITENANLREDIGMNSISLLYMAMVLETKYNIQFSNEDFEKLNTISDVISKIEGRV